MFDTSRKRIIKAGLLSFLLIIALGFTIFGEGIDAPMLFVVVLLIGCITATYLLKFKFSRKSSIIFMSILPLASFYLLEGYTHYAWEISWQIQVLNVLFYALLFGLLLIIFGKAKKSAPVALSLMMILGIANFYTTKFRSSPILPWDFLSLKTAMSVTNNYDFSITYRLLIVASGFILCIILSGKLDLEVRSIKVRASFTAAGVAALIFYTATIQTDAASEAFNLNDTLFTPNNLYASNGFAVSFLVNLQYVNVDKPEGYSVDAVGEIIEKTESEYAGSVSEGSDSEASEKPNIIVIMNETFSDPSVLGDFETNEDYMPFFHSLSERENTVTGNLFVSILGGNTPNSEFEFLTGNSMAFLPLGSIAYQQYINSAIPNLSQNLEDDGYSTLAIHPYSSAGWDRDEVYEYLGFDTTYFIEAFSNAEIIRKYVSDRSTYEKIIEEFESKDDDEKLFTFEVTMQNHGGYYDAYDNFTETIELLNAPEAATTTYTERYLSLMKESDIAFEELIAYFESVEEPTIIVMFGDHQPYDVVIQSILDLNNKTGEDETLEEEQARYTVPFAIWANYDIEEERIDYISANYLSTLLLEKAGLPLTGYQKFLTQLREVLPVITANIYIDADGNYYNSNDNPYTEQLQDYAILQYNNLFDEKNRVDSFFTTKSQDSE